uniref:Tc1-like transposase DDE domain-containing protein n=1 Tax=Oncorhynchus tshawytscha TaxID=74940 RepID=A0AAZ3Q191_ONCTS
MKTCSRELRLLQRFNFQQKNNPKHTAKTMQDLLRDKSLNVLEWPSQSLNLNPIEHLWRDLKIAVQRHSPSNLTELERICRVTCLFFLFFILPLFNQASQLRTNSYFQ